MDYTLNYNGGVYTLPRFTNSLRKKVENINTINLNSSVSEETKYKTMYEFLKEILGEESAKTIFGSDDFEEIDLLEVKSMYLKVCYTYESVVDKAKREAMISEEDKKLVASILQNAGSLNELSKRVPTANAGLRVMR